MVIDLNHIFVSIPLGNMGFRPLALDAKLTLNLLTTTKVAPPSNASKWQMGFNSAFKGLNFRC